MASPLERAMRRQKKADTRLSAAMDRATLAAAAVTAEDLISHAYAQKALGTKVVHYYQQGNIGQQRALGTALDNIRDALVKRGALASRFSGDDAIVVEDIEIAPPSNCIEGVRLELRPTPFEKLTAELSEVMPFMMREYL